MIDVDPPLDRYRQLKLQTGETVYLTPKAAKVFEPEYAS
jgi:hypothetical protein